MLPIRNVMIIPIKANKAETEGDAAGSHHQSDRTSRRRRDQCRSCHRGQVGETSPRTIVVASGFGLGSKV